MISDNIRVLMRPADGPPDLCAKGEAAGHHHFDEHVSGGALTNSLVRGRLVGGYIRTPERSTIMANRVTHDEARPARSRTARDGWSG